MKTMAQFAFEEDDCSATRGNSTDGTVPDGWGENGANWGSNGGGCVLCEWANCFDGSRVPVEREGKKTQKK